MYIGKTRPCLVALALGVALLGCKSKGHKLLQADYSGDCQQVVKLIRAGADVHATDRLGETPLHKAAAWGKLHVVKLLLEKGAKIDARDKAQRTPLFLAAYQSRHKAGSINQKNVFPDRQARYAVIRYLRSKGAKIDAKDVQGTSPLHAAISARDLGAVKVLLELGADARVRDSKNSTPLHAAARVQIGFTIILALVKKGADPDAQDDFGNTPLHWAVVGGKPDVPVIHLLLRRAKRHAAVNQQKLTPLQRAKKYNSPQHYAQIKALFDAARPPTAPRPR